MLLNFDTKSRPITVKYTVTNIDVQIVIARIVIKCFELSQASQIAIISLNNISALS
jgi:hypothetical protein